MILIIDTSLSGIGLALNGKAKIIESQKQSLELPGAVRDFLAENNVNLSDISSVGVVVGPGSFTGIRLGIAFAKGIAMGLGVKLVPINAFEIYHVKNPAAFIALDSGKGDFFCESPVHAPCVMDIDTLENEQMKCPQTVGHKPYELADAFEVALKKIDKDEPALPMYLKPSYVEVNHDKRTV